MVRNRHGEQVGDHEPDVSEAMMLGGAILMTKVLYKKAYGDPPLSLGEKLRRRLKQLEREQWWRNRGEHWWRNHG